MGKKIADTEGKLEMARMSPDGRHVAWLGAVSYNDPYPHSLFVMPAAGGTPRNLLGDYAGTGEYFHWKDANTILLVMSEMIPESRVSEAQRLSSAVAGMSGFLVMMMLQNILVF